MVRFEEVSLSYDSGPAVLHEMSFELDPGSVHFVLGASGAGKSSLLRLLYLAGAPTSGKLAVTPGADRASRPAAKHFSSTSSAMAR